MYGVQEMLLMYNLLTAARKLNRRNILAKYKHLVDVSLNPCPDLHQDFYTGAKNV
jgi:hypothetical protein